MTSPRALIEQIALYLGPTWKFNFLGEASTWRFEIIDGSGKCLCLRPDNNRLKITGAFPANRTSPIYRDYRQITVSMHRPPMEIAGDISRRFIPQYVKAFDLATEQYLLQKAKEQTIFYIAQLVKNITHGRIIDHDKRNPSIYFDGGEARIWSDETISLNLNKLSPKQAIQILSLVSEVA